jgi:MFS family permease
MLLVKRVGWSSFQTGLTLAAMPAAMALFSPLGGWWADRLGRRLPVVVGLAIFSIALCPLAWRVDEISIPMLLVCLAGAGAGLGLSASALQTSAVESVAPDQTGLASGIALTSRYLGSILGSSVLSRFLGSAETSDFRSMFLLTTLAAFAATMISMGIVDRPDKALARI